MKINVKLEPGALLPAYKTEGASGFDMHALEDYVLGPVKSGFGGVTVRTGFSAAIPAGYEIQIRGRSGLAFNNDILTQFGTIDEDYRGEMKVRLWNLGADYFRVNKGDRIAQGVLMKVERLEPNIVDDLPVTTRGTNGFGHTGIGD